MEIRKQYIAAANVAMRLRTGLENVRPVVRGIPWQKLNLQNRVVKKELYIIELRTTKNRKSLMSLIQMKNSVFLQE